jgi:hypothetical protein
MFRYRVFSHYFEFNAKQYTPQPDGSDVFYAENAFPSNFDEGERFVDGSVKWDGCSHYNFGDENGYIHLCGAGNFNALAWVLKETFLTASREIPHFAPDVADLDLFTAGRTTESNKP